MTTTEAAAALGVTRAWVWRLIKRGTLAAEFRGRDWWIEPEEVERYGREKNPQHRPRKPGQEVKE
jgi:excisionase family DNA binding protein